ncbi:hypothetical protein A2U01_0039026, partial [Trifolium medium]|nr:hypothetical protein [Trifolium medium]
YEPVRFRIGTSEPLYKGKMVTMGASE